jgi:hypothetical protein
MTETNSHKLNIVNALETMSTPDSEAGEVAVYGVR